MGLWGKRGALRLARAGGWHAGTVLSDLVCLWASVASVAKSRHADKALMRPAWVAVPRDVRSKTSLQCMHKVAAEVAAGRMREPDTKRVVDSWSEGELWYDGCCCCCW